MHGCGGGQRDGLAAAYAGLQNQSEYCSQTRIAFGTMADDVLASYLHSDSMSAGPSVERTIMNVKVTLSATSWKNVPVLLLVFAVFSGCNQDDLMTDSKPASKDTGDDAAASFEPVQPALELTVDSRHDDPTAKDADKPDPSGDRIRKRSRRILEAGGFHFAEWLPTAGHRADVPGKLRPVREVALRLMALDALFTWVNSPESSVSSDRLNAYIKRNDLQAHLTKDERVILALTRTEAHKLHNETIGWHLENMWALAWILGFNPPPEPMSGQVTDEVSRAVILDFLPGLDASVDDLLKKAKPRSEAEVVELEDVFYCAHNAVRSAQTGSKNTVPKNFHPLRDGGAIHERRHSLTWAISPGVEWDDTDLST